MYIVLYYFITLQSISPKLQNMSAISEQVAQPMEITIFCEATHNHFSATSFQTKDCLNYCDCVKNYIVVKITLYT